MSISGPHDVLPRRRRRPKPVLPVPTPDEVAAVRARVEARRQPLMRDGRQRALLSSVAAATLLALAAAIVLDLLSERSHALRWVILAVGGIQVAVSRRRARHVLQVDASVQARLDDPAAGTARDAPVLSGFERCVVGVLLALLAADLLSVLLTARGGVGVAWAMCAWVVAGLGVLTASGPLRAVPVGSSAVLRAVDGALRRRDLFASSLPVLWLACFSATTISADHGWSAAQLTAVLVGGVLVGVAVYVRDDGWLLRDARLATAPPPSVWLAGT